MIALELVRVEACPLCGDRRLHHLLDVPDHESATGTYRIELCVGCGAGVTNPRPTEATLPALYSARSSADFPDPGANLAQWLRDRAIDAYLRHRLSTIPQGGGVADYGCGDGAVCRGVLRARPDLHVRAIDFHADTPPPLRGLVHLEYSDHAAWEHSDEVYDAIFLRHVLEHATDPVALLRRLARRLRPAGRLVLEVPSRDSVWARWLGPFYFGWYVPRHLVHFDVGSLRGAVERAGLRVESLDRRHTPVVGGSLGARWKRPIGNLGPLGLASFPLQWLVDSVAGRSTTLEAVLVRA